MVSLSSAGEINNDTPLTGATPDGNTATSAISPALTKEGDIVVGVLDKNQGWTLQKRNANGSLIWKASLDLPGTLQEYSLGNGNIVTSADGGVLVFATRNDSKYGDPFLPEATYVLITKVDKDGYVLWRADMHYTTFRNGLPAFNGTRVDKAINTPDGGYLLVGTANPTSSNSTMRGWVAKLDAQVGVVWQKHYEQMSNIADATVDLSGSGSYLLNGYAFPNTPGFYASSTLRIDASGNPINAPVQVPYPTSNSLATVVGLSPEERPSTYLVGNDTPAEDGRKGDIRLTSFSEQGTLVWTKTIGGSARDYGFKPAIIATGDGYIVVGITESTDGDVKGRTTTTAATWIVKLQNRANALQLTAPTYTCDTGVITFNTTGGDGSPITYTAPGITRTLLTSNTGVVEPGLRNDPKSITITAMQSGQTATYVFDLKAYIATICSKPNPPTNGNLLLLAPTYNCGTGAIHFNTSGGDGSAIEFQAPGITAWSTNPDQFVDKESRTAGDVQPFMIMARQTGYVTTYSWNLKAACGRARIGADESDTALSLTVLGNPVHEQVRVRIQGAGGKAVQLRLSDMRGLLLESRRIESAGASEEQVFYINQQNTRLLFMQAITAGQQKTVKIIGEDYKRVDESCKSKKLW